MLTQANNELLTRTGRGTAMGDLFRRYWIPALLAEELPDNDCPPVRVKILSERLVAFRDTQGRLGLADLAPDRELFRTGRQLLRAFAQTAGLLSQAVGQCGGLLEPATPTKTPHSRSLPSPDCSG